MRTKNLLLVVLAFCFLLSLANATISFNFIKEMNSTGEGGEYNNLKNPMGVFANETAIYVVDSDNHRVLVFSKNYEYMRRYGGSAGTGEYDLFNPSAVWVTADRIYIADTLNHRVVVVWLDGSARKIIGTGGGISGLSRPYDLTVLGGKLYVADRDYPRVRMFDLSGNYLGEFNGDKTGVDYTLNNPQGIFAYGGMLYVADTENNRIVIYNITTGEVVGKLGRGPGDAIAKRPTRVFADEGIILVSDTGNNRIMVFYSNFTYAGSFGSFGNGTNKFSSPIGIFVQNKTLFVADSGNNKIKIYRIGGEGTGESINISETQARLAINSANETLAKLVSLSRSAAEIGLGADILDIQIRIADAVSAKSAGDYERAKEYADEANALATARVDELKKAIEREIGVRISACREMLRLADGNNTAYGLDIDAQGLQASIENTMREISSGNHEQAVMWVKLAEGNRTVVGVLLAASQAGVEARKSILQSRVYKAQEGINAIGVLAIAYNYSVETAELERRINDTILEIEAGRLESANDTLSELETEINRTIDGLYAKIKAVDKARNAIRRAKEEIAKGEAGLIKANMGDAIKEIGEAEVILYSDPAKAEEKALHAVNMARVENEKTEKIKLLLAVGLLVCSLAVFIAVAGIVLMLIKKRKK